MHSGTMGNVHAATSSASSPNVPAPPMPTVPPPAPPPTQQPQQETPILAPVDNALNPGTFEDLHKNCKGESPVLYCSICNRWF